MKVLVPIMLLLAVYDAITFAPLPLQTLHRHAARHMTKPSTDETKKVDADQWIEGSVDVEKPQVFDKPRQKIIPQQGEKKELSPLQKVFWGVWGVWNYSFIIAGSALSIGLLLNVLGYGYSFDFEQGLEIEKMERMIEKQQFRAEMMRPPSQLPK
jgi:hypothetical protein